MTGKRERILKGMLQAVGRKGFERATVQDAISEAGLYRQAFYDSFKDKEDCYLQAIDAGSAWIELAMREQAAGQKTWRGQLRGAERKHDKHSRQQKARLHPQLRTRVTS